MRDLFLACDFDGTLAHHGLVAESTLSAVREWKMAGNRFAVVTGRMLDDILAHFPAKDLMDVVVAEDGGVISDASGASARDLAGPPPITLTETLERRDIPFSPGRVIIYSRREHSESIKSAILEAGYSHQIIFNYKSAMIVPPGINKGSGLAAAARHLNIRLRDTIAIGDAENDAPMFASAGHPVAVANALPEIKKAAGYVTAGERGAGVEELIARLLSGRPLPTMA